ncbi:aldo/keto reductase, partial [Nonomuraea wenchangensis]|uniref:aldo/keto reductase n=1 Tax=Nonomuraea wenchangensis TaxID=568860 RepID=UPI0033171BF5
MRGGLMAGGLMAGGLVAGAQVVAAGVVLARLARGRRRLPPLTAAPSASGSATATAGSGTTSGSGAGAGSGAEAGSGAGAGAGSGVGREMAAPLTSDLGISVVVPARNEAARIGPCLRAVLADPAVKEVIVVDDLGNPDHDDSIRVIHTALDHGINFVDTADMYSA